MVLPWVHLTLQHYQNSAYQPEKNSILLKYHISTIYTCYVDNIFILNENTDKVKNLIRTIKNNSVINFVYITEHQ